MDLATLTTYYASLLAYQYRGKPNASNQIRLWAKQATADYFAGQLLTCFDLDLAVGTQLDVLGKYVGVSRRVGVVIDRPYFGLWSVVNSPGGGSDLDPAKYQGTWDPATNTPDLTAFSTGGFWWVVSATGASAAPIAESWKCGDVILCLGGGPYFLRVTISTPNGNGLTSSENSAINANAFFYSAAYLTGQNSDLTDAQYRTVIKLKIVLNGSDGTLPSIMVYLQKFFAGLIFLTDNKDMTLSYRVVSTVALSKELLEIYLPHPLGVGISVTIISPIPGGEDHLITEDGLTLTTEDGSPLTTETT